MTVREICYAEMQNLFEIIYAEPNIIYDRYKSHLSLETIVKITVRCCIIGQNITVYIAVKMYVHDWAEGECLVNSALTWWFKWLFIYYTGLYKNAIDYNMSLGPFIRIRTHNIFDKKYIIDEILELDELHSTKIVQE